jgi:DMSO/TMAO reductase YedYZ molybdopterin-dependent catalytic subunit
MEIDVLVPVVLALAVMLVGCATASVPGTVEPTPTPMTTACALEPIVVPTLPAEIPGYTELDPATGLHMTGTAIEIDLASYRLKISGKVDEPLSLTYDDLRCMPRIETFCTLICPGFFEDQATWAGASLEAVLAQAGIQDGADRLRLVSADGYATLVFLNELSDGEDFLAYEWEGQPLPIIHGFPVRAVFPALNGSRWVKWLVEIEVF